MMKTRTSQTPGTPCMNDAVTLCSYRSLTLARPRSSSFDPPEPHFVAPDTLMSPSSQQGARVQDIVDCKTVNESTSLYTVGLRLSDMLPHVVEVEYLTSAGSNDDCHEDRMLLMREMHRTEAGGQRSRSETSC